MEILSIFRGRLDPTNPRLKIDRRNTSLGILVSAWNGNQGNVYKPLASAYFFAATDMQSTYLAIRFLIFQDRLCSLAASSAASFSFRLSAPFDVPPSELTLAIELVFEVGHSRR